MSDVKVRCPNCGGTVEVQSFVFEETFIETADGFIYMGNLKGPQVSCPKCGDFKQRQVVELAFEGKGNLRIDTGGGAFIGGRVNTGGGDFVGRDSYTTIHTEKKTRR